jgi:hypothetical protein
MIFLPVRDNTLYEDAEGNVSSGSGQHMFVGRINRGSLRRGLVAFDLTGLPSGGQGAEASPGDATWLHAFFPDRLWTRPGGDLAATPSAGTIVDAPGRRYVWESTPELVADVQDWLSRPETNFGWAIVGNEVDLKVAKRLDSREIEDVSKRPTLIVSYTTQTATAAIERTWGRTKQSGTTLGAMGR